MTDYWPSFRPVVDVSIDKSLSFNSCLVAYFDYVLRIHSLGLSLSILITTEIYLLHLYRRLYHLFISQISENFLNMLWCGCVACAVGGYPSRRVRRLSCL